MRRIFDSHLDLSWNALAWNRDLTEPVQEIRRREQGMTDDKARGRCTTSLPELRRANIPVCLATLLARARREILATKRVDLDYGTRDIAYATAQGQLAYYRRMEAMGQMRMIRTKGDLRRHWSSWKDAEDHQPVGYILAMEGADPIVEPEEAAAWWEQGLRAVGLAHYGKSHYAVGTGGSGPLSAKGIELLKEFRRLGMILDLTHSSDPSFFQALELFDGPVMASHNNCRALVPGDRQYSDEQIRHLIQRGAIIGAALDAWMLKPGYVIGTNTGEEVPLDAVADHIEHVCQIAGNARHSAIGSDLDGGFGTEQSPRGLDTIADLHKLEVILSGRGFSDGDIDAIFHGNGLRFFSDVLPEQGQ